MDGMSTLRTRLGILHNLDLAAGMADQRLKQAADRKRLACPQIETSPGAPRVMARK